MLAAESGGRQYLYIGVNVHVILFRFNFEIFYPFGYQIVVVGNFNGIIDYIARMCYPLAANHILIFGILAERIAKASMDSCQSDTSFNGFEQTFFLLLADFSHGPHLDYQIDRSHNFLIGINAKRIGNYYIGALFLKPRSYNLFEIFRFMAIPSTPYQENFFPFYGR